MKVEQKKAGRVLVLAPEGRLDSSTAKAFEESIVGCIDSGESQVVVDFQRLDYISSAGLRVILMAAKKLKGQGGRIALSSLNQNIREVFDISGFSSILDIHPSQDAAVQSLS